MSAGFHPSDIYGRPQPPSEIHLQFTDDATIAPDDSVSQLGRRFTGRAMTGPRPMAGSAQTYGSTLPPPVPPIPESLHDSSLVHTYISPELLQDDASTVIQTPTTQPTLPHSKNETAYAATTSSGREGLPVYTSMHNASYGTDEADEYSRNDRHSSRQSLEAPLVPGAAALAGYESQAGASSRQGSGVSAYHSRSTAGYAAVNRDEADEGPYAAYRAKGTSHAPSIDGLHHDQGSSRWAKPLGYVKSLSGHTFGRTKTDDDDGAFEMSDNRPKSVATLASIDVAERQDQAAHSRSSLWQRLIWDRRPVEERIAEHKRGQGIQRWPVACWGLSLVFCIVMVVELVRMSQLTGSPIQTKPSFNVMIGPSGAVLINNGARFAGCMKYVPNVTDIDWICLKDSNKAANDIAAGTCTMSEICGFGGFPTPQEADQGFRFVLPIFLHAGIVHLLVNVAAQCFSSVIIERMMGTPKFLVLYFLAGTFGFILGANFALVGQPSVGASGAIFGTHAALLVDLLAHWSIEHQPRRKLMWLGIEIVLGLALGLVPGIDNFAHLGGFLVGLLVAVVLFPVIHQTRTHRIVFWVLRAIAAPLVVILFVVLTRNFYTSDPGSSCSWCRYLSCIPTSSNNKCKGTGLSMSTSSNSFGSLLTIFLSTFVLPLF